MTQNCNSTEKLTNLVEMDRERQRKSSKDCKSRIDCPDMTCIKSLTIKIHHSLTGLPIIVVQNCVRNLVRIPVGESKTLLAKSLHTLFLLMDRVIQGDIVLATAQEKQRALILANTLR